MDKILDATKHPEHIELAMHFKKAFRGVENGYKTDKEKDDSV